MVHFKHTVVLKKTFDVFKKTSDVFEKTFDVFEKTTVCFFFDVFDMFFDAFPSVFFLLTGIASLKNYLWKCWKKKRKNITFTLDKECIKE